MMLWIIVGIVAGILLAVAVALLLFGERGRPMRHSTWVMIREGGFRRSLNVGNLLHGYFHGRWTNQYHKLLHSQIFPRLGPKGKRWLSDRIHLKVLTQDQAEAIINCDHHIPLQDLDQIIPYPMARDFLLKGPPDVAAYECPCRHTRAKHCEPTQVHLIVGKTFVDFMLEHNPRSTRRITQAEALEILRAEHERGHLHSAFFAHHFHDRFFSICNCCKCCCQGIEGMMKHGIPMFASSGYVADVDGTLCTACGVCKDACPFEAMQVGNIAAVNREVCMGCGVCVGQCPDDAISLVRDDKRGIPLDVRLLAQQEE